MREIQVSRVDVTSQKLEIVRDFVAEETPLHIFLNKTHYVTILCSPHQLKELAIGHVLSEGVLKSTDEIKKIIFEKEGVCRIRLRLGIDAEKRISISQPLQEPVFRWYTHNARLNAFKFIALFQIHPLLSACQHQYQNGYRRYGDKPQNIVIHYSGVGFHHATVKLFECLKKAPVYVLRLYMPLFLGRNLDAGKEDISLGRPFLIAFLTAAAPDENHNPDDDQGDTPDYGSPDSISVS